MILGIQLIGVAFALGIIASSMILARKRLFTFNELIFWTAAAIGILLISLFPQLLTPLTRQLSFGRLLDLLLVTGLFFTLGLLFHTYRLSRETQKKLDRLAIEHAKLRQEAGAKRYKRNTR